MSITIGQVTEQIVNGFRAEVLKESVGTGDPQACDQLVQDVAAECREDGRRLLDMVDFGKMFEELLPDDVWRVYRNGDISRAGNDGDRLREHVASTIKSNALDRLFDNCLIQIMRDFSCPEVPVSLADQLTTRIDVDCRQIEFCEMVDSPPPDLCCMGEDEKTPYFGIGTLRCWKLPRPCKVKFAFGFNREMFCRDPNGVVRQQIENKAKWFDIIDERDVIKMVFNLDGCASYGASACAHPFVYNDTEYASYLNAAAAGPWTNLYTDPAYEITGSSDAPLIAIERLIENEVDPDTGEPIDCMRNLQFLIPSWADRYKFQRAIGPHEVTSAACLTGPCPSEITQQVPAREGWSSQLLYSRRILPILKDAYLNCVSPAATDAAEAEAWALATYAVGNFKQALVRGVEWDVETLTREGTDTPEYFDREVVFQRKYMRKQVIFWRAPWMVKLFRGFVHE